MARAQADFLEDFEDGSIQILLGEGWVFRSQNEANGFDSWLVDNSLLPPQDGTWYLRNSAGSDGAQTQYRISTWSILPVIPAQQSGDVVSFYYYSPSAEDGLEVRYSASGGTDTGSTVDDVGDFTGLLASISVATNGGWMFVSATVPGAGRLALRRTRSAPTGLHILSTIGIDTLRVGALPPPPCNLPPFPAPGETVTWTAAGGPYEVCFDASVPAGSAVIVEPGVQVLVDAGVSLSIAGSLTGAGTAQDRIVFSGGALSDLRVSGTIDLAFASFDTGLFPLSGGAVLFADTEFGPNAKIGFSAGGDTSRGRLYRFDRCAFAPGSWFYGGGQTAMRDTTFQSPGNPVILAGYSLLDNVAVDGSSLEFGSFRQQDTYVNGVSVSNHTEGGGLVLSGANFLLGPDNAFTGNAYPVALGGAGLLPGTVVPTSGNMNDFVLDRLSDDGAYWAKIDVPYVAEVPRFVNRHHIDPGVEVLFMPGAGWTCEFMLTAKGLPWDPIRFARFQPGGQWIGIEFRASGQRLEYCALEGAETAMWPQGATFYLDNCLVQNNAWGANVTFMTSFFARNSRFYGNQIAIRNQDLSESYLGFLSNPNAFVGNGSAIRNDDDLDGFDARHAWWGDPTGPQHPLNPGGQGDPVTGVGADLVDVFPFLEEPPDFTNLPPIVRIHDPAELVDPNEPLIFEWEVLGAERVTEQRILFGINAGFEPSYQLVATLPADVRSFEWIVPPIDQPFNDNPMYVRIVAVDDEGQTGWDEFQSFVTDTTPPGQITFDADLSGPFTIGDRIPVCWTVTGGTWPNQAYLLLDGDETFERYGTAIGGCIVTDASMWDYSTDTARIALAAADGIGPWYYSDYFEIRPDARIGDAPPEVTMLTPFDGDTFSGGSIVPITWAASDDQGLRSFNIQASFDGGERWHVIARDLPPGTRSFAWQLPTTTDVVDLRLRVIAKDRRFQNSSSGLDRSLTVTPGAPPVRVALQPHTTLVSPGEDLFYEVIVTNPGSVPVTLDAWVEIRKPSGAPYAGNPIVGPKTATVAAGRSITRTVKLHIPAGTPRSGPYRLEAMLGSHPDAPVQIARFDFDIE